MRTIRTKVYQFSELSEQAKENAINKFRNSDRDYQFYYDEIIDSAKKVAEVFNLEFGREYTDVRCSHIDDNILELSGIRLYKYIINNFYSSLFKPSYIKSIDRELKCKQFICKVHTDFKGNKYTMIYSRNKIDNSCTLTGVCYDMDILQPVYDFLKRPDKSVTFEDLINDIENAIQKTFDNTEEWLNSDDFITEEIEANEYEFKEDGTIF